MTRQMLVKRPGTAQEQTFCVPCANSTDELAEPYLLTHSTDVGESVCIECGMRIADVPSAPTYRYDVAIESLLEVEATNEVEAQALALRAITVDEGYTELTRRAMVVDDYDEEPEKGVA